MYRERGRDREKKIERKREKDIWRDRKKIEIGKLRLRLTCKWILHWKSEKEFKSSISLSSTSFLTKSSS